MGSQAKLYLSVLDKRQLRLLKKLKFLKKYGFYLAGRTGLALQIAHRTSLDFDFYTQRNYFFVLKNKFKFNKELLNTKNNG